MAEIGVPMWVLHNVAYSLLGRDEKLRFEWFYYISYLSLQLEADGLATDVLYLAALLFAELV
jgi:hypothetical protein